MHPNQYLISSCLRKGVGEGRGMHQSHSSCTEATHPPFLIVIGVATAGLLLFAAGAPEAPPGELVLLGVAEALPVVFVAFGFLAWYASKILRTCGKLVCLLLGTWRSWIEYGDLMMTASLTMIEVSCQRHGRLQVVHVSKLSLLVTSNALKDDSICNKLTSWPLRRRFLVLPW
jgi:hypothetical protein